MPVRGAVGGGLRSAHTAYLTDWIRKLNPSQHLRNKALKRPK
jgi:hypothetical protein